MEILAYLFIRLFIALIEVAFYLIKLPFILIGVIVKATIPSKKKTTRRKAIPKKRNRYEDPIDKMEQDFDNGELDLEDCFWMDELME